jgi:hypothetical protein
MNPIAHSTLLEFSEKWHLLPFVFLFLFVGFVGTAAMAAQFLFRCMADTVRAYYDFRAECSTAQANFLGKGSRLEVVMKRPKEG